MSEDFRKPAAFILEDGGEEPRLHGKARHKPGIEFDAPQGEGELVTVPIAASRPRRRLPLLSILLSAIATLIALGAGMAITQLVEDLFARSQLLGWAGLAVAAAAGLAAVAILIREAWGIARLNRIEHIQEQAARALNLDEANSAMQVVASLSDIYGSRHDVRWGLDEYRRHKSDIMDPRDRVALFDRLVLEPLDAAAHRIIARRSRRVTVLTTVTPAAALDLLFVAAQNLGMLRELAELYGGRPSTLATLKLARMVVSHLAVTGGLALSDNLLQHLVGKGLLGRLSARFGEGAVNGIMTARIGLAARDVCRPVPQPPSRQETLTSLLRELVSFSKPAGQDQSPGKEVP
jgi:putative membrane protein